MDKDIKRLVKALEAQGFTVTPTKKGHLTVRLDGRRITTLPGTPSDRRSMLNAMAYLKTAGFRPP